MRGLLGIIGLLTCLLSGCQLLEARHARNSTSVVQFLYPSGAVPKETGIPELNLPLRVGLAFLPSAMNADSLDAAHKDALLQQIRARFLSRHFITDIVIIPDYYLAGQQGFEGLDGVQRLYGVDLMALVSYDQVTHGDFNRGSLAYWTVLGAYYIEGNRNDVSTLIDLAVVDPKTRSLVIRAGGTDLRQSSSTLLEEAKNVRSLESAGYQNATAQMIEHFDVALSQFEVDVRGGRANVRVAQRNAGSAGGGALTAPWLLLLAAPLFASRSLRARRGAGES
jgi:rhombotail lipoprotein